LKINYIINIVNINNKPYLSKKNKNQSLIHNIVKIKYFN